MTYSFGSDIFHSAFTRRVFMNLNFWVLTTDTKCWTLRDGQSRGKLKSSMQGTTLQTLPTRTLFKPHAPGVSRPNQCQYLPVPDRQYHWYCTRVKVSSVTLLIGLSLTPFLHFTIIVQFCPVCDFYVSL